MLHGKHTSCFTPSKMKPPDPASQLLGQVVTPEARQDRKTGPGGSMLTPLVSRPQYTPPRARVKPIRGRKLFFWNSHFTLDIPRACDRLHGVRNDVTPSQEKILPPSRVPATSAPCVPHKPALGASRPLDVSPLKTICAGCHQWMSGPHEVPPGTLVSHGVCPECQKETI
jgi:hypothetical protein